MGLLVQIHPFAFAEKHRYLLAERDGEVVGFLAMVPVYAREGGLRAGRSAPVRDRDPAKGAGDRGAHPGGGSRAVDGDARRGSRPLLPLRGDSLGLGRLRRGLVRGLVGTRVALALALARVVALVVTAADALLTLFEALVYNVPNACGRVEWLGTVVGVVAPWAAAFLLWRARALRAD